MATYMYEISSKCEDILGKMADEDHVSNRTEIELLISKEWKERMKVIPNGGITHA